MRWEFAASSATAADHVRRRRHGRRLDSGPGRQPGGRPCAASTGLRVWPRSAAVQSLLAGPTCRRGHRDARQDDHDLDARDRPARLRRRPVVRHRLDVERLVVSTPRTAVMPCSSRRGTRAMRPSWSTTPFGAVITNVDVDHLDFFGTPEAYARGVRRVPRPGRAAWVSSSAASTTRAAAGSRHAARALGLRTVTVGAHQLGASCGRSTSVPPRPGRRCEVVLRRRPAGHPDAAGPRPAYVVDALAALAAGLELGYPFDGLASGLADFRGTGRRMELEGCPRRAAAVYDSYAHHPVEIASDLRGRARARRRRARRRVLPAAPVQPDAGASPRRWGRRSVRPTRSS